MGPALLAAFCALLLAAALVALVPDAAARLRGEPGTLALHELAAAFACAAMFAAGTVLGLSAWVPRLTRRLRYVAWVPGAAIAVMGAAAALDPVDAASTSERIDSPAGAVVSGVVICAIGAGFFALGIAPLVGRLRARRR
ncbi:hypothetical protein LG943_13770 [Streptomonospora sp. S1-112]|uniref:Uncharacterized protein n=1 Tax=Streptomonospora mangrovi TaxID=2883123 RepID=A0A9X3NKG5_9ACTN|nr:hypothetical protein [Streptomonospora mangrovi]MDA0565372.1 hypothetical protein [Streptomonospora mangrovi]